MSLVNWSAFSATDAGETYRTALPFPHVVVRDALSSEASILLKEFPEVDSEVWHRYPHEFQKGKQICSDPSLFPPSVAGLIRELTGPRCLAILEGITGIHGLIPDPYFEGGGLHCSGPGGILRPHTDFHLYPRLSLYRRLNLLVYLNPGWEESWGGCLELYPSREGRKECATVITPSWGTCVIFETSARSPHGFSVPINEGHWRRSIALYYYTATDSEDFSGDYSTHWRRSAASNNRIRARRGLQNALLRTSRALAILAHWSDPDIASGRHRDTVV